MSRDTTPPKWRTIVQHLAPGSGRRAGAEPGKPTAGNGPCAAGLGDLGRPPPTGGVNRWLQHRVVGPKRAPGRRKRAANRGQRAPRRRVRESWAHQPPQMARSSKISRPDSGRWVGRETGSQPRATGPAPQVREILDASPPKMAKMACDRPRSRGRQRARRRETGSQSRAASPGRRPRAAGLASRRGLGGQRPRLPDAARPVRGRTTSMVQQRAPVAPTTDRNERRLICPSFPSGPFPAAPGPRRPTPGRRTAAHGPPHRLSR
jgi:hypothetical protein